MDRLEIRRESFPTRCEVCHQTDRFDPEHNFCFRCGYAHGINHSDAIANTPKEPKSFLHRRYTIPRYGKLIIGSTFVCLILVGLGYFNIVLPRARNEAAAKQQLRKLYQGQAVYLRTVGKLVEYSDSFQILQGYIPNDSGTEAGILDPRYDLEHFDKYLKKANNQRDGYRFVIKTTKRTNFSSPTYFIVCYPNQSNEFFRTGDDCFYIDQTGIIRHSGSPTKIPDANSPPVE